jgi:lipoyl(octanoyl) transferase
MSNENQKVILKDLEQIDYQQAWEIQERLLAENVQIKSASRNQPAYDPLKSPTRNHLLLCEHSAVYTLGKSGNMDHVLLTESELSDRNIQFFKTNRGGDITFHGQGQLVGYPILDLEKFTTDIGLYLRNLEEVIIQTIANFDLVGKRSAGETGVWLDPDQKGKERKICAIGVRCSRWITMHGFALNVNTDLNYFNHIIPCGIVNKQVTSLQAELGHEVKMDEVKKYFKAAFESVYNIEFISD